MGIGFSSVNGDVFSWASFSLLVEVARMRGIVGLDYAEKIENEFVHADNQDGTPVGMTYGKYTPDDISLRILRSYVSTFENYLIALAPTSLNSIGAARFTMTSKLFEPSITGLAGADVTSLGQCRVMARKNTHEEGTGALITEYTLKCMTIVQNGNVLYDATRGLT